MSTEIDVATATLADSILEQAPASQYSIAANATFQERRTRTLKQGDTFVVFDHRGNIGIEAGSTEGLYYRDTRILSKLSLLLEDSRPLLLSSMVQDDNSVFVADLSNPDFFIGEQIAVRREQVHLHRLMFVSEGAVYERLSVRNFSDRPLRVRLKLSFEADFADLFEVRGENRKAHGRRTESRDSDSRVTLRYVGLDAIERNTTVEFAPAPLALDTASASFEIVLQPHQVRRVFTRAGLGDIGNGPEWDGRSFYRQMRKSRQALCDSSSKAASVDSSNSVFNEVMRRSIADLYMLITETPLGPYPYAGTPWFSTPFGRDGIITALTTLWADPSIAKGVLKFLAATQATTVEPARDAEPGKILHEMRHGEMANLNEIPFGRYYGSVDATPLFVLLLGEYFARTADIETIRDLWPNALAALQWIDTCGDRDGDGFVEYLRQTDTGLANQGWKDSQDAIFHSDGRYATGAIALCEVQAYVYGAKRHAAALAATLGDDALAQQLQQQADALQRNFEDKFWCEELSIYALALDGAKRPCKVVSSNAGQVLLTGIAQPDRAARVARTLLEPKSFSGWGIRTLATSEAHYNPMSYHNGSVWPHDNGLIALGFARYGQKDAITQIFGALFDAASYMDLRRLPELYCGFPRAEHSAPTQYPVACSPQAWASAATLALIQASLGLTLCEATKEVSFYRPRLPKFIDELHLRNLRLACGSVDVHLKRHGNQIALTQTRREGDVNVLVRH
jgi:glycogen debranching enzyme